MGNAMSSVEIEFIRECLLLGERLYKTYYYSGMAIIKKGMVLSTKAAGLFTSSAFLKALVAILAAIAIAVAVVFVVMTVSFVIYKIVDGIVYMKQCLSDKAEERELDEHIKRAEREARRKKPDVFIRTIHDFMDDIDKFAPSETVHFNWTAIARAREAADARKLQVTATCSTGAAIGVRNGILAAVKEPQPSSTLSKEKEEEEEEKKYCLWEEYREKFAELFYTTSSTPPVERCVNSYLKFLRDVTFREIYDLFDEFSIIFDTLEGSYTRSLNIPSYTAADYKCNKEEHCYHAPIVFPGHFYRFLNLAHYFYANSGRQGPGTNIVTQWYREERTTTGHVVYIMMCKICTLASHPHAFYVGLSTGFEVRIHQHRHTLTACKEKTLPDHIYKQHAICKPDCKEDLQAKYFQTFIPVNSTSRNASSTNLRCHEIFHQWLLGPENVMNKR